MIKHIVFDVDRTLVDSFEPEILSVKKAIETVKGYKLSSDEVHRLSTLPTRVFFKSLNLSDDDLKLIRVEWEKEMSTRQMDCFKGIRDVIKSLYDEGYGISILTSRNEDEIIEIKDIIKDIIYMFSEIITSNMVDKPKPNIDSMELLCRKLNCTMDEVIYIGDSIIDRDFAKNCNTLFIPACWDNKELINEANACTNPIDVIEKINGFKD